MSAALSGEPRFAQSASGTASSTITRSAETSARSHSHPPSGVARVLGRQDTVDPGLAHEMTRECSARTVSLEHLKNGTALPKLAQEYCQSFLGLLGSAKRLAPPRRITIGTACSGSAADLLSFLALEKAYQVHVPDFEVEYLFNCESHAGKRKWGMALHGLCSEVNDTCCFKNIACLHQGQAECARHNKLCRVRHVDVFVCSTSCKDFSKANPHRQTRAPPGGESARTLPGMNAFLGSHRPPMFLFENVNSMDDAASGQESDMDIALSQWATL